MQPHFFVTDMLEFCILYFNIICLIMLMLLLFFYVDKLMYSVWYLNSFRFYFDKPSYFKD